MTGGAEHPTLLSGVGLMGRPGRWDVLIEGTVISSVTPAGGPEGEARPLARGISCGGWLIPGFVDCHTHACWHDPTGDHRLDEWEMKRAGKPYLEILAAGGGIMATVRAVRAAHEMELTDQLAHRLDRLLRNGSTTIEVKSGYGLTPGDELKMLRAIRRMQRDSARGTIVPTALLGHAIDPDVPRERFIETTIEETLPRVSEEFPGITIDAFCEQGAWTLNEAIRLFEAALKRGHPIRVHADQFNTLGMTAWAVAAGARSVDHLEASGPGDLAALVNGSTYGVGLPACGFHLDGRYAKLGKLAAAAPERVCIATNLNPGSAPCWSMAMVVALAVRHCGLSARQAFDAATINPARLLGFTDRGTIAPGMRADLVLLHGAPPRGLAYNFGDSSVRAVWTGGRMAFGEVATHPRGTDLWPRQFIR